MDARENHKYEKWCHDNGIKIYPIPVSNGGLYKIALDTKGNVVQGKQTYKDSPLKGEVSVWDKIRMLYKEIFEKNNKE